MTWIFCHWKAGSVLHCLPHDLCLHILEFCHWFWFEPENPTSLLRRMAGAAKDGCALLPPAVALLYLRERLLADGSGCAQGQRIPGWSIRTRVGLARCLSLREATPPSV